MLKIESGPFTLALSNIAEAQTSIQQVSDVSMKVYPTIATSQVSIDFDAEMNNVTIQLVSSSGAVVYSSVVSGNSFTIPLSGVAKGVYSVKVTVNSQVQTIPIVVQ
jgi:hypothetical protein